MKQPIITVLILSLGITSFSCKDKSTQSEKTFEGITETNSTGPTPVGNIDPDDWRPMMDCSASPVVLRLNIPDTVIQIENPPTCTKIYPAYPNPANKTFVVSFSVHESDSMVLTLNSSPTIVLRELMKQRVTTGTHSITVDGSSLPPSIYRIYIFAFRKSDILTSYGDVKIID
jgi:hypothetical protein